MLDLIDRIYKHKKMSIFNEEQTKHTLVLPILNKLNWDIFNPTEVIPEYEIHSGKVDYALINDGERKCFIECKRVKEDLTNHEKQLVTYCATCGVKLAILTNGISWWFYLPLQEGDWSERKFYSIDILKQNRDEVIDKFVDLLKKENVLDGSTFRYAEELLNSRIRSRKISKGLPEVWNNLIENSDSLLIELLIENTESKTGYKPSEENVKKFINKHKSKLIINEEQELIPRRRRVQTARNTNRKNISPDRPQKAILDGKEYEIKKPSRDPLIIVSEYLIKEGLLKKKNCPIAIKGQRVRYIFNVTPKHRRGNRFLSYYILSNGIYLNTHYSVEDAIIWSKRILEHFGLSSDLVKFS